MKKIRAILLGLGRLGLLSGRLMSEKGVDIVGAIDRPGSRAGRVGRDIGDVAGLGRKLNVIVKDSAEEVLSETEADIVYVAVTDDMARMFPIYELCLRHGFNVLSVGSEASYSWRSAPDKTRILHELAVEKGVTLCGSGNQDLFMINAATLASGVCHKLHRMEHESLADVNGFGAEVAAISHVGKSVEDFEASGAATLSEDSVYLFFWENVCADLGVSISSIKQHVEPLLHPEPIRCDSLDRIVEPGRLVGVRTRIEIETHESIHMRGDYLLRLCAAGERQFKTWRLYGEPNLELEFRDLDPGFTTASQPVNRIPDVINAPPGYVTLEKLPKLTYRARSLEAYLHR